MSTNDRDRPAIEQGTDRRKEFELRNTHVVIEHGPAGLLARIERIDGVDYAGPLSPATVDALGEVAHG